MLSDSDLSSSSEAEELAQQKREAEAVFDKQRVTLSHYFADQKNHKRWVSKCTSRIPEPPAHRSIKKIAMAASEMQSMDFFFQLLSKWALRAGLSLCRLALFSNQIVAVKALTTTLCVFQMSALDMIYQSLKHISLLKEMSVRWRMIQESDEKASSSSWAPFISRLANILTNKVYFLNKYTAFGVNYALVEGAELDVEDQVNVPARLSTLLANLNVSLQWVLMNPCSVLNGTVRPLIEEAHSIYLALTVVLADLLENPDEPETLQAAVARYERLVLRDIIAQVKTRAEINVFDDVSTFPFSKDSSRRSLFAARSAAIRGKRRPWRGSSWGAT